jgi:Hsp20/alpha crystallin family protein
MTLPVVRGSQPAVRWDRFVEFEDLYDRMGRLTGSVAGGPAGQLAALAWSPLAGVSETDNAYLIEADLPGVSQDQVSVEVSGGDVVISGEITRRERAGVLRRAPAGTAGSSTARCCRPMPTRTRCRRRWPMACTPCGWPRPRPPGRGGSR